MLHTCYTARWNILRRKLGFGLDCRYMGPLLRATWLLCAKRHIYITGLSRFPDKRVDRQHESRAKASYSFSEPHSLLSVRRRRVLIMHLVRTPFARRSGQKERYRVLERHTTAPIPRTRQHVGRKKLILAQAYRGAKKRRRGT